MEENGNLVRFILNQNREVVSEEDARGLNRLIRGTELIASRSNADCARTYYHYASDEMGLPTWSMRPVWYGTAMGTTHGGI